MTDIIYPSKLLLFGEYTVINKSQGLALPFTAYSGKWDFLKYLSSNSKAKESNHAINGMLSYLNQHFSGETELNRLQDDLINGLWFNSNIPYGYGLGSSGALCAAIYDRYFTAKSDNNKDLLSVLSKLEGYFHGTSSGIDPLVSYTKEAILIETDKSVSVLHELKIENFIGEGAIFVIDSGQARKDSGLINYYLELCKNDNFDTAYISKVKNAVAIAIASFRTDRKSIYETVNIISELQYSFMKKMIPEHFLPIWKEGLDHGDYLLKLCGAGGGGFLLGFCKEKEQLQSLSEKYPIIKVMEF